MGGGGGDRAYLIEAVKAVMTARKESKVVILDAIKTHKTLLKMNISHCRGCCNLLIPKPAIQADFYKKLR